jgi:hypothetical protein
MSAAPPPPERGGWLARGARMVVAPLISGSIAAIVFLVMIQGAFRHGYTDFDFNHVLGTLVHGTASEATGTRTALGVVGDTAGPTGLWATVVGGIAIMVVHELAIIRMVRRHWLIQAIPLALLTILVVGVAFPLVADAHFDTTTGLFATGPGGHGPLVVVVSSIGFAIVGARIHALATGAEWWGRRGDPLAGTDLEGVGLGEGPPPRS